jgi:hypothetical protein
MNADIKEKKKIQEQHFINIKSIVSTLLNEKHISHSTYTEIIKSLHLLKDNQLSSGDIIEQLYDLCNRMGGWKEIGDKTVAYGPYLITVKDTPQ